jgi:hypothetical protein
MRRTGPEICARAGDHPYLSTLRQVRELKFRTEIGSLNGTLLHLNPRRVNYFVMPILRLDQAELHTVLSPGDRFQYNETPHPPQRIGAPSMLEKDISIKRARAFVIPTVIIAAIVIVSLLASSAQTGSRDANPLSKPRSYDEPLFDCG